jgi:hypothetical protein
MRESLSLDVVSVAPSFRDLAIDRALVESDLGYRTIAAPEMVRELIDEVLPEVPHRINIQCGFCILPAGSVRVERGSVVCGDTVFSTGSIIASQLKESTSIAVFLSSIGPSMEQWSSQLMNEGDMMKGYVLDAIASDVVGRSSEWLERRIAAHVKPRGWKVTNAYSPGYCDWSVSDQHALFSLFPEKFCDVTLTPSALMVPIKSLTGIIGLGPGVKRGAFQCSICDLKDCFRRREESEFPMELE